MFRRIDPLSLRELTPKRICLIKPSALGDVVQSLPLVPVLRHCFPRSEINWVINRELRGLVDDHPDVADVIPFERRGGIGSWRTLLATLHSRRFDLVIDMQGLFRTAIMTWATRAAVRVGLETAREGSSLSTNCVIPDSGTNVPAHARYWRLAEVLGCGEFSKQTFVATSKADQEWAASIIGRFSAPTSATNNDVSVSNHSPIIAVHPGARWETKRWPVEKFAALLARAVEHWQAKVLLLGSKAERPDADRLESLLRHSAPNVSALNLAGESSLKQLAALLSRVDMAISNDSGPLHLAAGLGTPSLGLFTCTSAVWSGPAGEQHEMVSTTVPCAASYCKTCPHSGTGHLACLKELDVDRVWLALRRLAEKNRIVTHDSSRAA